MLRRTGPFSAQYSLLSIAAEPAWCAEALATTPKAPSAAAAPVIASRRDCITFLPRRGTRLDLTRGRRNSISLWRLRRHATPDGVGARRMDDASRAVRRQARADARLQPRYLFLR